ncbi:MAG TPA: RNA polymerase sigma factor [Alphaproteobacteria bacterium]|nr:RNA polymerase sigma factor [Alphaproteobacteria bacterium]
MAEPLIDEKELVRQLKKGNESAFAHVYGRYQAPIYRFALHMSGNAATAEEVTQEVFMLMISKPGGFDPAKGSLAGYLFGIARNLTRRSLQKSMRDIPLEQDEDQPGFDESVLAADFDILQDLSQAESFEQLRKAVLALPEQYREAVVVCELEELSYSDAAAILQCSQGTLASRLNRAKAMLRTRLLHQRSVRLR